MSNQYFVLILFVVCFLAGLYLGKITWNIDPTEKIAKIVSCEGYEEEFLKKIGYKDRNDCVQLNLALNKQYVDDCLKGIKLSGDDAYEKKLLDLCVFHLFEKDSIFLTSEYVFYKRQPK